MHAQISLCFPIQIVKNDREADCDIFVYLHHFITILHSHQHQTYHNFAPLVQYSLQNTGVVLAGEVVLVSEGLGDGDGIFWAWV